MSDGRQKIDVIGEGAHMAWLVYMQVFYSYLLKYIYMYCFTYDTFSKVLISATGEKRFPDSILTNFVSLDLIKHSQ